jgi:hypothetical protein
MGKFVGCSVSVGDSGGSDDIISGAYDGVRHISAILSFAAYFFRCYSFPFNPPY